MYLNQVTLIGNLTRDPELKAMPNGNMVCNFSIATNRVWKDKEGQKQEEVEYSNVTVYGKQAESTAQYMKKGNSLLVIGRLKTRSWDKKDGTKGYATDIIAERVQFGSNRPTTPQATEKPAQATTDTIESIEYPDDDINPEDIPF